MTDRVEAGLQPKLSRSPVHPGSQHGHDILGRAVAEQLAKGFLVPADAMRLNQLDKILRRVAGQGGFGEMPVLRQKVRWTGVQIGEVTAPAAGNPDLFAGCRGVIHHQHPRACMGGAKHAGGSGPKNKCVDFHPVNWRYMRQKARVNPGSSCQPPAGGS